MSDRNPPRRLNGKKIGKTWNHGRAGDKASRSEGREPVDNLKQRAVLKRKLQNEVKSVE